MTKQEINKRVTDLLNDLINHDTTKFDTAEEITNLIMSNSFKSNEKAALDHSVSAIYFNDRSDYLSAHYAVVRELAGVTTYDEIEKLFKLLNPE